MVPVLSPAPASPAVVGPSPGPVASPDAAATYRSLAALPVATQVDLVGRLAFLSQLSYLQNRSQLISDQGGGIISNHSSGLITNNGANILSNHGGGIVSNHSSGLIGNNGGSYRLAQAPTPEVALATEPLANTPDGPELLFQKRIWLAGGERRTFETTPGQRRRLDLHPLGLWPFREQNNRIVSRHPDGDKAVLEGQEILLAEDGSLRQRTSYRTRFDASTGLPFQADLVGSPSFFRYQELGDLRQEASRYSVDALAGTGSFALQDLGRRVRIEGTLQGVKRDATQRLYIALGDPLAQYPGSLSVSGEGGAVLYRKTRRNEADGVHQDFDLGQGTELRLRMTSGSLGEGSVVHQGSPVGTVKLEILNNGSLVFTLKLGPDPELVVGYGSRDTSPPPTPVQREAWLASSPLGGPLGDLAGPAAEARFQSLRGLVADPGQAGRWYATDFKAQRLLLIEANPWRVTRVAGTGALGDADGPGLSASFRGPLGVAVGPDGSVYVAENEGHRIRRARLQSGAWVVDTVAGSNSPGFADGPGLSARFDGPAHVALSGTSLYVADQGNHRIRRVQLDQAGFPVDTVAGDGSIGLTDGPLLQAKLGLPLGLTAQGQVLHTLTGPHLRRIDLATGQVSTLTGSLPSPDFFWRDGPKGQSGLLEPSALMPFPNGAHLVGGPFDLRLVQSDGSIRSLAGSDGFGGNDGEHDQASFNRIFGLAPAGAGAFLATECQDPGATSASPAQSRLRLLRFRPKG